MYRSDNRAEDRHGDRRGRQTRRQRCHGERLSAGRLLDPADRVRADKAANIPDRIDERYAVGRNGPCRNKADAAQDEGSQGSTEPTVTASDQTDLSEPLTTRSVLFDDLGHERRIPMNLRHATIVIGSITVLGLAGCGETKQDRALSGAAIGAGAGAAAGGLTGGSVLGGAALGGAAGAAGGYFTDKNDINLGKPLWKR
jgi:osmotically inducible lipoprotein OsmB